MTWKGADFTGGEKPARALSHHRSTCGDQRAMSSGLFKNFTLDENVSTQSKVKSSVMRGIVRSIEKEYPCFNNTLDQMLPKKEMAVAKWYVHTERPGAAPAAAAAARALIPPPPSPLPSLSLPPSLCLSLPLSASPSARTRTHAHAFLALTARDAPCRFAARVT
jgi:hypothetical protein